MAVLERIMRFFRQRHDEADDRGDELQAQQLDVSRAFVAEKIAEAEEAEEEARSENNKAVSLIHSTAGSVRRTIEQTLAGLRA
ncbi:hypothetical protein sos41_12010 [Alphaproteobacteria bacterium SO-S41]|nr:hypothetical protein sos41_12010 [Alphaproteobacteria bacterium SO-S41]